MLRHTHTRWSTHDALQRHGMSCRAVRLSGSEMGKQVQRQDLARCNSKDDLNIPASVKQKTCTKTPFHLATGEALSCADPLSKRTLLFR